MSEPIKTRPPQVTLASGLVIASSLVVLVSAWGQVASLGSLDTQAAIDAALSDPPVSSLGLDADGLTGLVRVLALVAAASACATGILGWWVRRPDKGARLGLTVFAVVVFLAGLPSAWLPSGSIAGSFVAAGAAMLWMVPAREWFATGRWTPPPPREPAPARTPAATGRPGAGGPPPPYAPPPAGRPFGEHPSQPWQPQQAPRPAQRPVPVLRPGAVVTAFVLTVVMAGGLLALSVMWIAMAGLAPDLVARLIDEQQPELAEAGVSADDLRGMMLAMAGGFVLWCSVALVLAGFVMARRDWARRGLMVVAALSAGASLALLGSTTLVLVPAAAALVTVVLLRRVEVRRWFSVEQH
ncbi:hypothetical protein KDN32_00870 [Nocardioides sp. J2M5]|uniref:hypothetical protein n=1 Tax=Nocardioides palaemonis TaxID=2829810 RepID=UPI001BA64C86|nr:hypothetical protein [Nocardioides palaemonis]MBS2936291.1 hypothetical protein [Nocardioides palaemonis]